MDRENLNLLTILLCIGLVAPSGLGATGYGAVSVTLVSTDPVELNPGSPMTMKLKFTFSGDQKLENLTATLDATYPFAIREGHAALVVIGDVSGRPVIYKDFYLDVAEGAQAGTYTMDVITCHPACEKLREETELSLEVKADPLVIIATTTLPDEITSGSTTTASVILRNVGRGIAENVRVEVGTTPSGSEDTTLFSLRGTGNVFFLGDLPPDKTGQVDLKLQTSARASGFYTLPLTVDLDGGVANPTLDLGIHVVNAKPVVELAAIEGLEAIAPGETKKISLTLQNTGKAAAKNVRFSLTRVSAYASQEAGSGATAALGQLGTVGAVAAMAGQMASGVSLPVTVDGVIPLGDSQHYVAELAPDASIKLDADIYAAPGTPEGAYQLTAALTYEDALGTETTGESSIGLSVMGRPELRLGDSSLDPEKVRPGNDDVLLAIGINNVGTGLAKNVVATVSSPVLDFGSARRSVLGNIAKDAGRSADFRFDVTDETKPGEYEIVVHLEYVDNAGNELADDHTYTLIVNEKPQLSIAKLKASALKPGNDFTMTITVQNTGSEEAESASVKAIVEGDVPFVFETKSDYLGNIAPGETAVGVLAGRIESDGIPKDYKLAFELRAVGDREIGDSNVYVFADTQSLAVTDGQRRAAGEETPLASRAGPIVVVLLLAGGLVYYVTRTPNDTGEKK